MSKCAITTVSSYRRRDVSDNDVLNFRPGIDKCIEGILITETNVEDCSLSTLLSFIIASDQPSSITIKDVNRCVVYDSQKRRASNNVVVMNITGIITVEVHDKTALCITTSDHGITVLVRELNRRFGRREKSTFFVDTSDDSRWRRLKDNISELTQGA